MPAVNRVVLHDPVLGRWLVFRDPDAVVVARRTADVVRAFERVEAGVAGGLYAAGFVGYEAAPAFDSALSVRTPADSSLPLLWFGLYRARQSVPDLDTALRLSGIQPAPPSAITAAWQPTIDREQYTHAVERVRDYIYRGDTYQINFTFRLQSPFRDGTDFFRRLVHGQGSHYAACIETGGFSVYSASPELFFRLDGNRVESRPMKGTIARGRTLAEDKGLAATLRESPKNQAENVMIVDMIRNDLGRVAVPGTVRVESLFDVRRYPTVWQMTSTVAAETGAPVREILAALFPCASVTGAPKPRSMAIIAELESTPRGLYCGTIGYLSPGRCAQFNVAIRTVVADHRHGTAEYGVGGGIVWDSVTGDEYEECRTKALVLTREQPEFQLLETLLWTPGEGFFLLDRHLLRITESAEYFDFAVDLNALRARLAEWGRSAGTVASRVRLLVGPGGETRIEHAPLSALAEPARIRRSPFPVDPSSPFLYHKTTRRDVYDQARLACPDCDDVLLWNQAGEVTETTIANVVADVDGQRITPPVSCGLLPGTFRAELLAQGQIREAVLRVSDLSRCRGLYLISSVRRWRQAVLV